MFNIAKGGSLTLINVNLVNGRAGFRGGVIENYGVCNIIRSSFVNNSVDRGGVVVWNNGIGFSMIHSNIINTSVVFRDDSPVNLTLIDSSFVNGNDTYRGVIENNGGFYTVISSSFVNNSAYKGLVVWNNCTNFSMIHSGVINTSVIANVTENDTNHNFFPDEFWNQWNYICDDCRNLVNSSAKAFSHFVVGKVEISGAVLLFKSGHVVLAIPVALRALQHGLAGCCNGVEACCHLGKLVCHSGEFIWIGAKTIVNRLRDKVFGWFSGDSPCFVSPLPLDAL